MNNVAVTFGVICRKEKVNLQNEAPLYIRLSCDNKRKLISLKEKINIDFWDFENKQLRYYSIMIEKNILNYQSMVRSRKQTRRYFSINCQTKPLL